MKPKTLSASSIIVSEGCMARWKVENFDRAPRMSSAPADVGTTCHYVLEKFVEAVYLTGEKKISDKAYYDSLYDIGYMETFGSGNFDTPEYADGKELVEKWYVRLVKEGGIQGEVLSVERKETFPVKTSEGVIPFTYIFDRVDRLGPGKYRVTDYKSIREFVRPEDLRKKIQPRAYALAVQVRYPDATEISVVFDMLRQDESVGVTFSRDDNIATYRYIQRAAERILSTPEDKAEETINTECKWCIRKTECETLTKADASGMIVGLPMAEIARRKMIVDAQMLALKYAQDELDKALVKEATELGELEFDVGNYEIKIGARKTRKANSNAIAHIVGAEVSSKYGNFSMANIDKMLKSGELTPEQEERVREQIASDWGTPSAKVKPKGEF